MEKKMPEVKEINLKFAFAVLPSNSMLVDIDSPKFTILLVSDNYVKISGKSRSDLIGNGVFDVFPPNSAAEGDTGSVNLRDSFEFVIKNKKSHSLDLQRYDVKNENGTFTERYWLITNTPVFDDQGNVIQILHSPEEITDKIKAEKLEKTVKGLEQVHNLFMQAPVAIHIFKGKDLLIELANEPTLKLWDKGKEIIGKPLEEVLPEVEKQEYIHLIKKVFETGQEQHQNEAPITIKRNGKEDKGYYNLFLQPYYEDKNEKPVGVLAFVNEVTEEVKAKKITHDIEIRFRQLANSLPIVVWSASPDGNLTFISNQWEEVYGNPIAQSLGKGWANFVHLDDVEKAATRWAHSISSGELYETEFRVKHKSGGYHWILVRAVPIYNEVGEIVSWSGSNTDIQDKKLSEEAFTESEERFRSLADNIPNLAWMADADGWIFWYNNRWYEYTGTTPKDMEGWGWQSVHDQEKLPQVLERWQASIKTGNKFEMVFPLKGTDGKFKEFLTRVVPVYDKDGKIFRWLGTNTDITQQRIAEKAIKESEQNLKNVILQAPVAMCLLKEPNFIVEIANEKMFELWGRRGEDVMHKPIVDGLPEIKEQGFDLLLEGVYTTGKTYAASNVPAALPRNGKIENVFVNFVYEAYREADGKISGILAVAIDVTEQVIARQKIEEVVAERTKELAESNNNLQKTNDELAQFAYIASHDLQEPLRKISVFSQMLEKSIAEKLDAQSRNYLNKINNSSSRMIKLIRDVLTYSELGRENITFESVNLNEVIENSKADYDLLIEQKGATINYKDLPTIEAIPIQMSQLFSNLIGNALKFIKKDVKPVITINARKLSKEEISSGTLNKMLSYYEITFTDNGIGFDQEYSDQIFSIFQRLHRKSDYEGTGIGLALCKKIALNHHGDLNALRSSKNGAVFTILLPEKQVVTDRDNSK